MRLKPLESVYDDEHPDGIRPIIVDEKGLVARFIDRFRPLQTPDGLIWGGDTETTLRPEGDLGGKLSDYSGPVDSASRVIKALHHNHKD